MAAIWRGFSSWYFNKLTTRLQRTGLTFHDALAETGVYEKAIGRLPAEMQVERARRIKRAFDLTQKHEDIPVHARENPWREYHAVRQVLSATQKEHDERMVLSGKPFIPYNLGRESWFGYDTKSAWFWKR